MAAGRARNGDPVTLFRNANPATDITAADVGATISGLGLLVRQFPAWRSFLAEAQEQHELSDQVFSNVRQVANAIIEQSDVVVEPALREGLASVQDAASSSGSAVLKFGLLRAVSNTLRAIGRYLRDRARGTHAVFTKEFEQRAGELLAKTTLGAIIGGSSGVLLEVATGYPNEFGWLIGFIAFLKLSRKE